MKVALIGGFAFSPKGTMRARTLPIGTELARLGHEVTMFLPPYDNLGECGREWEQEGVRIRNIGREQDREVRGWRRLPLYLRMLVQLIREVRRYQPDVIHVFKPKGFAGAAATYFLLRGGATVVLDCDDWEGWGGWNEIKEYPRVVKQYVDWQERWLIKRAQAVTVASRALEARDANLRRNQGSVFYIPNCGASGADRRLQASVQALPREQVRCEFGFDDRPVVLYSGHFEERESVAFFCRAAATVAAKHRATVVFLGNDAPEEMIREYFLLVADSSLRFFPHLGYEKFLRLVWACDVAAFPYPDDAVHRAKCSARITDYMAMGRAVLTSGVGQNMEYIVDGESGLLAAPDDWQDFAAKLDRLLSEPQLRDKLGSSARHRIKSKFQWSSGALEQCLAAYDYALDGRRRPILSSIAPTNEKQSSAA